MQLCFLTTLPHGDNDFWIRSPSDLPVSQYTFRQFRFMKCPYCQTDNDKVIDSRSGEDGFVIRRRRMCVSCDRRFTTYERVAELEIRVVKKDGSREPFRPEKIRQGLERACWKRPIPTDRVENVITEIIQGIYIHGDSELPSELIGEMVMDKLVDLDDVAYIRFASVYRQFRDFHDFIEEVKPILDKNDAQTQAGSPKIKR
ncbi:MAG: transcriptional repressor NrdR [Mariniblastus sp.]|jgi:transcriptional repressor NrdR